MTVLLRTRNGRLEKQCVKCREWHFVNDPDRGFHRHSPDLAGGVKNVCKSCRNASIDHAVVYQRWRARQRVA